jgi:signal transduction histidine kinase
MLLSGFGVVAIRNEAQAEAARQRDEAVNALKEAESQLVAHLGQTDNQIAATTADWSRENPVLADVLRPLQNDQWPIKRALVVHASGKILDAVGFTDSIPDELALRLLGLVPTLGNAGAVAHLHVREGVHAGVVSARLVAPDHLFAYWLDEEMLDENLRRQWQAPEGMRVQLRVTTDAADRPAESVGVLQRLTEEIMRRQGGEGENQATAESLARETLDSPFDRLTLVITAPPTRAGARNTIIYVILLAAFYITLIVGVVLTSRLIWRETRLSRLKTDFVSHISHELRTPLTSIRMFIDTLRLGRAQSDEEVEECLTLLTTETERLSEMIERVLGYARLQSGRRAFSITEVQVADVVQDAINAFHAQTLGADKSQVELNVELPDGLPSIMADAEALVEAILNLLSNAYKYGGRPKQIRVRAHSGSRRVQLSVSDNGPGIAKVDQARIFDRFYRAKSLLSASEQGTGLGLAISKRIVESTGGKISVHSEPEKGTTFTVEMPIAR